MKMPETYDELVTVLQAFKDKDANGNGDVNDEIPFGSGNFDPTFCLYLAIQQPVWVEIIPMKCPSKMASRSIYEQKKVINKG